jgi:hypothetical protein
MKYQDGIYTESIITALILRILRMMVPIILPTPSNPLQNIQSITDHQTAPQTAFSIIPIILIAACIYIIGWHHES